MLDVTAIARCHRCNVISLPLHPNRTDPTYAAVTLPHEWLGGRLFTDGEDTDFILCPECNREAWEWLTTKVARKSTREEERERFDIVTSGGLFATFALVADCDGLHHWHDSFVSTSRRVAVHNETYCKQCGVTYRSWAEHKAAN